MELDSPEYSMEISSQTLERSTALKYRFTHFYTSLLEECVDREKRRLEVEEKWANQG